MLAVLALVAFLIAGLMRLVGLHADVQFWCLVIGGALLSVEVIRGWTGPWHWRGGAP